MREIKFRAWNKYKKEWVNFIQFEQNNDEKISCYGISESCFELLPETGQDWIWLQYAGLRDKNGKEIYEGDIIQLDIIYNRHPAVSEGSEITDYIYVKAEVYFNESEMMWCLRVPEHYRPKGYWIPDHGFNRLLWCGMKPIEVIGNIYENPELMETSISKPVVE